MNIHRPIVSLAVLGLAFAAAGAACAEPAADQAVDTDEAEILDGQLGWLPPASSDPKRNILSTALTLDVANLTGKAKIRLAARWTTGASFEIGDLEIKSVKLGTRDLSFTVDRPDGSATKGRLDVGVPRSILPPELTIEYAFESHSAFDGWSGDQQVSFIWPYFCSNLFPCHSSTEDGSTFTLDVRGVPAGKTAVYPKSIPFQAPSYMPAVAIGDFAFTDLGTTSSGTHVGFWVTPENKAKTEVATAKLKDAFQWYESTLGAYKFGGAVGSVQANWGEGAYGGMEHHPYWHIGAAALGDELPHVHEAAHGWYGNGVRMKCWEDWVLSEGTTSYLAARAIEVVRGKAAGDAVWADYKVQLAKAVTNGDTAAYPSGCNAFDILQSPLWSNIPYMKGAFFYKAITDAITPAKLDGILAKFYAANVGKAVTMNDMIAFLRTSSGFDPSSLVATWLTGTGNPNP